MPEHMSYPNADLRRACTRKKAYADEALAEKVARKVSEANGANVVAYGCTNCGAWHIGNAPRA